MHHTIFHSCLQFQKKGFMRPLNPELIFVLILTKVYILVTLFIPSTFLNPKILNLSSL